MYAARLVLGVLLTPKLTGPEASVRRGAATLLCCMAALLQWRVSMCGTKLTRRGGRRGRSYLVGAVIVVYVWWRLANHTILAMYSGGPRISGDRNVVRLYRRGGRILMRYVEHVLRRMRREQHLVRGVKKARPKSRHELDKGSDRLGLVVAEKSFYSQ